MLLPVHVHIPSASNECSEKYMIVHMRRLTRALAARIYKVWMWIMIRTKIQPRYICQHGPILEMPQCQNLTCWPYNWAAPEARKPVLGV